MTKLFIEMLQVAIGIREKLSKIPSDAEWISIYEIAQKQSVAGFCFDALNLLAERGQKAPLGLLYEWIGLSEQIKQRNILLNKRCVELTQHFSQHGFKSCILKGQPNALMYPNPTVRTSGDIDIWIDAPAKDIIDFVRSSFPKSIATSLHIDYPIFEDVDVEVHFIPFYSIIGRRKKTIEKYIEFNRKEQFDNIVTFNDINGCVNRPTDQFNMTLQLLHMQKHFFRGGIGLRHIVDFYYLLLHLREGGNLNVEKYSRLLKDLGLQKFAEAIMWILSYVFKMKEEYIVTSPNENRGKLVFQEVLMTGNFGHYEKRNFKHLIKYSTTLSLIARNIRLFRYFPEEAISAPLSGLFKK